MTLNLMLSSRSSVYLSGDFRLTYGPGKWEDHLDIQKLIPIFTFGWSALVSFAGVARTSSGLDVGDWVSHQLAGIDMNARFDELPKRLLAADNWLSKVRGYRPLVFSIVGFIGRKPVAMVISNFTNLDGHIFDPVLPKLRKYVSKPRVPEVRIAGDRTAVGKKDIGKLTQMLMDNRSPREIEVAMAEANVSASDSSSTISPECVTAHLLPTGKAEVTPHGIDEQVGYFPAFVRRDLEKQGVNALKCKVDENGNPLPPRWKGMTASMAQGPRRKDQAMAIVHGFGNVEEVIGAPTKGSQLFTKIVGEDEPERYTFQIDWGRDTNNANQQPEDATIPVKHLEAGKHVTTEFSPALHFEVDEGWSSFFSETFDGLHIGIESERSNLIFASPVKVFDPSSPSEQKETPAPESVDEWISWFQTHPNLAVSTPVPVSVGGATGVRIEVTATSTPENFPQYCSGHPCVPLFTTGATPIVAFAPHVGFKDQFVIVNVSGKTVVVNVSAQADKFDAFLLRAQKVLDTVEWKGP